MENLKPLLKKSIPYFISILVIIIVNIGVFYPQLENKVLQAGDIVSSKAKMKHTKDHFDQTGEISYWNPAQFGGGPSQMLNLGRENNYTQYLSHFFAAGFQHGPLRLFIIMGLVMFVSLSLLRVNPWIGLVISVIYMLNTNFITILEAGHNSKVATLAYFPLIISGLVLCFKSDYIKGGLALAIGTSLALYSKHIQMTYYLILCLFIFGAVYLAYNFYKQNFKKFSLGVGVAIVAALFAGLANFAQLNSSQKFAENTMRGEPILMVENSEEATSSSEVNGLAWTYAMGWSFEVKDLLGTIIPRAVGGGSQEPIDKDDELAQLLLQNGAQAKKGKVEVPGYWGSMAFTSAPAYIGVSLIFFFVFSLIAFREKPLFWSIAGAMILIALLSLGSNAAWINKILFNHLPLFNKFRAPSSISTIIPAMIAIGAAFGIQQLNNSEDKNKYLKSLYISLGIVGGVIVFIGLFGGALFSFLSPNDLNYPANIQSIFIQSRKAMQSADAWRSLGFVVVCAGTIWIYIKGYFKGEVLFALILGLIFIADILPIDRRYLTSENFISKTKYEMQFLPTAADKQIAQLEPNGRGYYRVLNLATNTFNDAKPAYHHNQIGGYDPAKLQRIQDIIDRHISQNNMAVLNMLNAKYIITQEGQVQTNPAANGNAWFVSDIQYVDTPEEEINALNTIDNKTTAVINRTDFDKEINTGDKNGTIALTNYQTNQLTYKTSSNSDQFAVFSEVWYGGNPDWTVTIDGQNSDFVRANYILRAMEVPAGEHEIVFTFKPKAQGAMISTVFSLLIMIGLIASIGLGIKNKLYPQSDK